MAISFRKADIFAAGLLFGAAAVWLVVYLGSRGNSPDAARANAPSPQSAVVAAVARPPAAVATAPTAASAATQLQQYSQCPIQPAVTPGGDGDGRVKLQAELSGKSAADVAAFIVAGKEAAAADRPRDAEVAFMMACRASDSLLGSSSPAPADARYQLGRHYASAVLAGDSGASPKRAELLKRSEVLYSDSLQSYVAKYGKDHEKSRFAAEGLTKVQQNAARTGRPPVTVAAAHARPPARVVPAPAPQRQDVEVAIVNTPVRQATGEANRGSPSFDCRRARSYSERTICADSELARLDRDLGRLHARAKSAAMDSAAFRRRNDREWQRRESSCRDRDCLMRWYAERRNQLMNDDAVNFSER